MSAPNYESLFNPLLKALYELGGSGTVQEIESRVSGIMKLNQKDVSEIHKGTTTKFSYRLAWARTYLKRYGTLENSKKGVWRLTSKGLNTDSVDPIEVYRVNRIVKFGEPDDSSDQESWKQQLLKEIRDMSPSSFEYLCQNLLREAGFEKVEVTGRTVDGGIDGKGIMRIGGLLSFGVVFQCKRYQGSVPSKHIRDFRGAMSGRSDKGLFITTGRFTPGAIEEAQREGALPIDIIDGAQLADLMLELNMGVITKETVDKKWFDSFKLEHKSENES